MPRRFFRGLLTVLLVVASVTLWGCQPPPKVPKVPTGQEKITLEFWTLQMLTFSDYINGMIGEYEKAHPNVEIKWVDVPFSEGEKKALTSMLAQQTPDVINLNPDFSAILASRGALLDMNDWVTPQQQEAYLPVAWQAASLDSQTFGLPWYLSSAVTLYNRELLQKAGFSSPPTTYEDMARMATVMKAKTPGYILMPSVTDGGRFFRVLQKAGVGIWDADHKLAFAENGAGKELAFWVRLYQSGLVPQESLTEGQQAAVDRYQSGTLGLLLTGPNFLNIVKENAPKIFAVTEVAPQFPAKSSSMDFSEMLLVVPKRTAHPKEAVEFALFVTNAQNTLKLAALAPVLPPHQSALRAKEFQQGQSTDILAKARSVSAQQLLSAQTVMQINPQQNRLNQIMDFYVQSAFLGKRSPEEAMQKAQQDMNKLLD
jgi:putative chitobiose transport system substrate-binding protein